VTTQHPPVFPADVLARAAGLIAAALLTPAGGDIDPQAVIRLAGQLSPFVLDRRLVLHVSSRTWPQNSTGHPRRTTYEGDAVQIKDNEQFPITVDPQDSKGFDVTGDQVSYTVDNAAVVTLQPSDDGLSCNIVAGAPGSAVVTVAVGDASATEAVDVVPGDVATITISEGTVTTQA
jgi:hypothetical protein